MSSQLVTGLCIVCDGAQGGLLLNWPALLHGPPWRRPLGSRYPLLLSLFLSLTLLPAPFFLFARVNNPTGAFKHSKDNSEGEEDFPNIFNAQGFAWNLLPFTPRCLS